MSADGFGRYAFSLGDGYYYYYRACYSVWCGPGSGWKWIGPGVPTPYTLNFLLALTWSRSGSGRH